jgi:hypothetical protein
MVRIPQIFRPKIHRRHHRPPKSRCTSHDLTDHLIVWNQRRLAMEDGLPSLSHPMDSLPFLIRLVAATLLARQNRILIAEVTYLRAEIAYLRDQQILWPPVRRDKPA